MKQRITELEAECVDLKIEYDELEAENADIKGENAELKDENSKLRRLQLLRIISGVILRMLTESGSLRLDLHY